MGSKKKIVLVTSSQPSLNPRIVKEADALVDSGYNVVMIGVYWNNWATETDKILLKTKKWKYIRVGGTPEDEKRIYLLTRFLHKIKRKLRLRFGLSYGLAESTISRCNRLLLNEAIKQKADLYIGHNPGGMAPAINAAKQRKAKCGFDAEDFHRKEYSDDPNHPDVQCKQFLEEKYYPQADYITAASPLIALEYSKIFPEITFTPILNVFPKPNNIKVSTSTRGDALKLFWFSQTLGHNRGIAEIIEAIGIVNNPLVELHLLANPRQKNIEYFNQLARSLNFEPHQLNYHNPIPPEELFSFASNFDIGLASETGFGTNNNIALSNKLFTYIASGLAVLYSNTPAQESFMKDYSECGIIYDKNDPRTLAKGINVYLEDREKLNTARHASYILGQQTLNWETESQKFLKIVEHTLGSN